MIGTRKKKNRITPILQCRVKCGTTLAKAPGKHPGHRSAVEIPLFDRKIIQPIIELMASIWPGQIHRIPGMARLDASRRLQPDEIRARLRMIQHDPPKGVTDDDILKMLRLVRRILAKLNGRTETPQVQALYASANRMRSMLPSYRGQRGAHAAPACRAKYHEKDFAKAVISAVNRIGDVLVMVVKMPKGSGRRMRVVSWDGGDPDDPNPHRRMRGKGRGGLIVRTGIANCPYRFLPDHETIEFCPCKGKRGKTYRIRITQEQAWKIVNRLSAKMESGKDDWYTKFTARDANVLRSANAEFLKDCVERERCPRDERKGNRRWTDYARLRRTAPPWWK